MLLGLFRRGTTARGLFLGLLEFGLEPLEFHDRPFLRTHCRTDQRRLNDAASDLAGGTGDNAAIVPTPVRAVLPRPHEMVAGQRQLPFVVLVRRVLRERNKEA